MSDGSRNDWKAEIHSLYEKLQREQERCLAVEQERDGLKQQLNQAVHALASMHSTDTFRVDDAHMVKLSMNLRYDIKTWSKCIERVPKQNQRFDKKFDNMFRGKEPTPKQEFFGRVVADPSAYLHSREGRDSAALIQSYIWYKIITKIYAHHFWLGSECQFQKPGGCHLYNAFYYMNQAFEGRELDKDYNTWRTASARLVDPYVHERCVAAQINHELRQVAQAFERCRLSSRHELFFTASNRDPNALTLERIFRAALEFDRIRWQQQARYVDFETFNDLVTTQQRPAQTTIFRPDRMEIDRDRSASRDLPMEQRPKLTVELLKAPGLVKHTINDADEVYSSMVLLKAAVDIK